MRRIWVVSAGLWVAATASLVIWSLFVAWGGNLIWCEATTGDSNYGEIHWSAIPPGHYCSWSEDVNGFAATTRPSPDYTAVIVALLLWGVVLAVTRNPAWSPRTPDIPQLGVEPDQTTR